jgi:hypothetical protein
VACALAYVEAGAQGRAPYDEVKARFCSRPGVSNGPAILFGRVLDADTDAPIAGADISLVYTDSTAEKPIDRLRRARTTDDGSYAICGLPETYAGTVQATHGKTSTAEAPVATHEQMLLVSMLTVNVSGASASKLRGHVTVKGGGPVPGAQVAVQGATSVAVTGADGAFTLDGLPSGTQAVVVRKIGFAPATVAVNLSARAPQDVAVVLAEARVLATVRVVGKMDNGLQQVGFADRQRSGRGHFISPKEVEERRPLVFTDLLQTTPGFRVTQAGRGRIVQSTRSGGGAQDGCVNIFVDRTPFQQMQAGDLDDTFNTNDIGAVELYASASDTPAEFQVTGRSCATIAMWTKTRLARP